VIASVSVVHADATAEHSNLEQRVGRLANERTDLFEKAGASFGLSRVDRQRLSAIERELDECFVIRRQRRAIGEAHRFSSEGLPARGRIPRRPR
jgi:Protein of unknown function (DUF2630)